MRSRILGMKMLITMITALMSKRLLHLSCISTHSR